MTVFDKNEFKLLSGTSDEPCVSIYMPTHESGVETIEGIDSKHYKNKVAEARDLLEKQSLSKAEAEAFLARAFDLIDDKNFWRHQRNALAVFIAKDFFKVYKIPVQVQHHVITGDRFYLKPLIRLLSIDDHFYLLTLSQKQVKLYEGTYISLDEVQVGEAFPTTFEEALGGDVPETQLQYYSMKPGSNVGGKQAVFHGQRSDDHMDEKEMKKFFDMVDKGINKLLNGQKAPLLLAGVDELMPVYRKANSYSYLLPDHVPGNHDEDNGDRLHESAMKIVQKYFDTGLEKDKQRFNDLVGTGKASDQLNEILVKARTGMVDTLFVDREKDIWGRFDLDKQSVAIHKTFKQGDDELLNLASTHTILMGGNVHMLDNKDLPSRHSPISAVFRSA